MIFERHTFKKPMSHTEQSIASGTAGDYTTGVSLFSVPWDRIGYLKRVELGRGSDTISGCLTFELWDHFSDDQTDVSGAVKRKDITLPADEDWLELDIDEDIEILEELRAVSTISGIDATVTCRTIG